MTCFRSEQKRSRLRREILAAFCVNRSGRIQEKASYIADIQGFLLSIGVSFWPPSRAENGTRTRAARERFRESRQTPPAPGRGVLRSQVPSPLIRRHTKRGKNLSVSSLFWSGKRDSHSRCARAVPRNFADTPGPWKGRFEVAGAESPHAPAYKKREEPFGFFPLLERKTGLGPATSTLARLRSTN